MLSDIPIFSVLKTRMQWHQARQKLLAENVANADSPGYRPRDLERFDKLVASQSGRGAPGSITVAQTAGGHLGSLDGMGRFDASRRRGFETTPSGNSVSLEEEMMKIADNQGQYQLATTLYSKSLSYLRTALGRRA
jgi:flagellar basal-body rod protein FlgB